MHWDQLIADWDQLKEKLKQKWSRLTEEDLRVIRCNKQALVGRLRELYVLENGRAESDLDRWLATL